MIRQAAREHDVDLARSCVVGDRYGDVELAQANGGCGVLVRTGYGAEDLRVNGASWARQPDFVADDLADAVDWILRVAAVSGRAR
jgi:D-glycero-D-manno-heptose 1,7-bisphosphate phosphatase